MVLHATVEKLTTWITLLLLSQPHWYLFSPKVASSLIMGPQHYPRISRFRLIRRSLPLYDPGPSLCRLINRLLPSCSNHSRSIITSTSPRSNPLHAGHGTNYLMGIICTILPRPHRRMGILLISGQPILGSPRQPGILRRRRVLLLPTLHTDEIYKWTFGGQGERGERNHLKSLVRRFSSLLSSSAPSKSVALIPFWSCLLSGFHHLFIVFAIHAPSFPFNR